MKVPKFVRSNYHMAVLKVSVIIIGLFVAFIGTDLWNTATAEQKNAMDPLRGTLNPPYPIDLTQPVHIELGGVGRNVSIEELSAGIDLTKFVYISINNQTVQFPIQIVFGENSNILVSARIKDDRGNILADIQDNEWKAPSSDSMDIWDKNYNSFAFEVIDSNKIPVLQIILGSKNEIAIGFSTYHQGVQLYANLICGLSYFSDGVAPPASLKNIKDSTIFNYPSKDNLGVMKQIPDYFSNLPYLTYKTFPSDNPLADSNNKKTTGLFMAITGGVIAAVVGVDLGIHLKRRKQK